MAEGPEAVRPVAADRSEPGGPGGFGGADDSGPGGSTGPRGSGAPGGSADSGGSHGEVHASAMMAALGGGRGLLDSALPATVFVLARILTHDLTTAVLLALVTGVALLGLRRLRGEPLAQVGSGFVGLVLAVLVARATGTGKGFFLPGIITTALTGVAFLASLAARRPAVGIALAAYDPRYAGWREHPRLRRACAIATWVWAVSFFVRAGVATYVYRLAGDNDGLLLVVINVVKWPLIAGAALLTVVLVRRADYPTSA